MNWLSFSGRILAVVGLVFIPTSIQAGDLTSAQDVVTDSRASALAGHTISFYVTNSVPISGKIIITPSAGDFNIESGLSFSDIDLLIDNTQKTLGSIPGTGAGSAVGVSVATGSSGSITLTLNDTEPIPAGALVEIRVGDTASFGGTGTKTIQLPSSNGSYRILLKTQNSASTDIDSRTTMIFVASAVEVTASRSEALTPSPSGGGPVVLTAIISAPEVISGGPVFISGDVGAIFVTSGTSTVIVHSETVNALTSIFVPIFNDRDNVVILPIDSKNKLVATIYRSDLSKEEDIFLLIRRVPESEVASISLPTGRNIIGSGVYRVAMYVNGVQVERPRSPVSLAFFYGSDGFLPEPVDLYRSRESTPGWGLISGVFKDTRDGLILHSNASELSYFAVMGVRERRVDVPAVTPPIVPLPLPPVPDVNSTHPDPYQVYDNSSPEFSWILPEGVDGVSFILDQSPLTIPDDISEGLVTSKSYQNLSDGTWYFHIKFRDKAGWGRSSQSIIQVKTAPSIEPPPGLVTIPERGYQRLYTASVILIVFTVIGASSVFILARRRKRRLDSTKSY